MNIVLLAGTIDRSSGGIHSTIVPLAKELADAGHRVNVLGAGQFGEAESDFGAARLTALRSVGPRQFRYMPAMKTALASLSADVVHTHGLWTYASLVASRWSRRTLRPRLVSTHGMLNDFALSISSARKRIALPLYERRHLRNADCIHALTHAELDAIRRFGLRNPVCVIPNGIDLPQPSAASERPPWGEFVGDDDKVLLYLGRLHPIKGLDVLLRGWHSLRARGHGLDWKLVVAGWEEDDYHVVLKNLVRNFGIGDSVLFCGPQFGSAKAACFEHCDAFVLPSRSEGFPITVLEAWSYGLPVMMTDECNVPEGFEARAAIRVPSSESGATTGLMTLFDMSVEHRADMGKRGSQLVHDRFSWPNIANKMLEVYEWLTAAHVKPPFVFTAHE